jgi:predicted DNA-binding transcriptional regulator YafY
MSEQKVRAMRLHALEVLLLSQPERAWRTAEIAEIFAISSDTAARDLADLSRDGRVLLITTGQTANRLWHVSPDQHAKLPPVRLDYAQGAALFAAARLLGRLHDERNEAVSSALIQLVGVFPEPLRPHLEAVVTTLNTVAAGRDDLTSTFIALGQAWLGQHIVLLTYEPAHQRPYQCRFAPYLLEPSGIGYTMYFLGWSDPPGKIRTYKLERIRHAELTDETFTIPPDFDGRAMLSRAWGVMAGEGDLAHIKLRFSHYVARRVRETRWHISETISETDTGLIWEADIGDVTEIRPWIRGWGSDCEVLEPASLREEMQTEVRRMMRLYGIRQPPTSDDGPDQSLIDDLLS